MPKFELVLVKKTIDKSGKLVPETDALGRVKYHEPCISDTGYDIYNYLNSKSYKSNYKPKNNKSKTKIVKDVDNINDVTKFEKFKKKIRKSED